MLQHNFVHSSPSYPSSHSYVNKCMVKGDGEYGRDVPASRTTRGDVHNELPPTDAICFYFSQLVHRASIVIGLVSMLQMGGWVGA